MEYLELDNGDNLECMNHLNGRVDAITNNNNNLNFNNAIIKASEHQTNIISRNIDSTEVSKLFFSLKNIDLLQQGIRNKILKIYLINTIAFLFLPFVLLSLYILLIILIQHYYLAILD